MPDFHVSPISVVNQIKSNLQDRYETGYQILKELIQNADDSESQRFRLDALPGWPGANNPLLRGPGLLVVNDGKFRKDDERGITSFGESSKATDSAAIGKFGFGQKAVFHLCDAFVVYAYRKDEPFSTVVNPFLRLDVDGNITKGWELLEEADLALLHGEMSTDFPDHYLALWLPFRREGLRPAPDMGFSSNFPSPSETIKELVKPRDLGVVLTALRHLRSIEIREHRETHCVIDMRDDKGQLLGPNNWRHGTRSFGGTVEIRPNNSMAPFVGRESIIPDGRLVRLQNHLHWPKTITVLSSTPQPEKGEPHGAATLLRAAKDGTSQLRISWAVFLPISDSADIAIELDNSHLGPFRLLLHGYFFLDSGRRNIEGLTEQAGDEDPNDATGLRRAWNAELRDSVVLPLVPTVLRDALDAQMVTSAELAAVVAAIAGNPWFHSNRKAICRESALVRVLEAPSGIVWRLVPSENILRPLPASVSDGPRKIVELFGGIHSWAAATGAHLVVDKSAALSAEPMVWTDDDLGALFAGLSARAFQSRDLARLLTDFLSAAMLGDAERAAIGPHLVAALRKAMIETQALASNELVKSILAHVLPGTLFPLPASVENRQVLRALARASTKILSVRSEWLDENRRLAQLSNADLKALLTALEPLIGGDHADQAATAALTLLAHAGRNITELASDPEFAAIEVLRARNIRINGPVVLSLKTLVAQSRAGLLFANSPQANSLLPLLADTLPEANPVVVEGKTAEFLRDSSNSIVRLHGVGNESILDLVNGATRFGTKDARRRLLERLRPTDNDDRAALRRLCVGDNRAGHDPAMLHVLEGVPKGLERIVEAILNSSSNAFLVSADIADELTPRLRQHIGITALDTSGMAALLERDVNMIASIQATPVERDAFLLTQLPDALLRRLPIHARFDGTVGTAEKVFREAAWPIPEVLRPHVPTIQPCANRQARERQERLIDAWSPLSQIEVALVCTDPHRFRGAILDALAKLEDPRDEQLLEALRAKPWLLADEQPVRPQDVLALPPTVDEAARALLLKSGETPPFLPVAKLSIDVREHGGFGSLERWVLPDRRSSFEALALMIEDERIIGRLGPANKYPVDDFATLASDGGDLGLPGWLLLAAVLTSLGDSRDDATKIVAAFVGLNASNAKLAGSHLGSLTALAEEKGRKGEAARRAYRHGFNVVAGWPEDARRKVFGETRVPTEDGSWRSGREVIQGGDGLDPRHVLVRYYASMLGKHEPEHTKIPDADDVAPDPFATSRRRGEIKDIDLVALETQSADQQRSFLDSWKGRIPSDLVIVYLGLTGRSEPFRCLANEWATDATAEVDTLWADLDNHFPKEVLYPGPLAAEVDQRRFLAEPVARERVQAIAMSGDSFDAPLGGPDKGILIGNLHKTHECIRTADGRVRSLITLSVRQVDPSGYSQREASEIFRRFVETIAAECLGLIMERQRTALQGILEKAVEIDQSTIEETERLLRDRLPTILGELKLPNEYRSQKALREYQAEESRLHHLSAPAQKMEELKTELWRKVSDSAVATELLSAVRSKIGDFGYSASRVLFELFQNADDAYRQHDGARTDSCFRVELLSDDSGGFRVVHWGRPINHMGRDAEEGRRLGHDRDLLNMLLMNFSEKRPGDDLTGKFGLGFKSVHVLSDGVGIASGFIALRTVGGFLPAPWPEGIGIGESRKRSGVRKATVIDVPFSTETTAKGAEALAAFRAAVTWLPAFTRTIRRVEIEGDAPVGVDCSFSPLPGESEICVVSVSGQHRERALRFDLSSGFCLLLRVDAAGPCAFPNDLRRLWNLAPLEEELRSGWLLNGPFAVDPGRTGLAGSITDQQEKLRKLGRALGDRLLKLHDLADADWRRFAENLDLDASKTTAWGIFWSHLFDVFAPDFDDDLARYLHADGYGYSHLAGQRQVVPTRLPAPFASLVRASEADYYADGALSDRTTLGKVRNWPALAKLQNRIVTSEVAGQLKKLGFGNVRSISLADMLRHEMEPEKRVDVEHATRLGQVLTLEGVEQEPLNQERQQILDAARQTHFRAQDGSWRSVRDLNSEHAASGDEKLLCGFAPENMLLDRNYQSTAFEFFKTARSQSGYGPQVPLLLKWARNANGSDRHRAVLRYLVEGRQARPLAEAMRGDLPSWIPRPLERLLTDAMLATWTDKEKKQLLLSLDGHNLFNGVEVPPSPYPAPEPKTVLSVIHEWWHTESADLRASYARRAYPEFFSPSQLRETQDRTAWFTMFALACFQSLGRTQDEQHRGFIEAGYREGWWQKLSESRPPDEVRSWLEQLERWSASSQFDQQYLIWRRTFVDLYSVARWLEEYREVIVKLPRTIEEHGVISLNGALQPSYWPPAIGLSIDAAPINRSLGFGINWMIREMLRHGAFEPRDESLMAPYCWSPSLRVRTLLNKLGADIGEPPDKEASRTIHEFLVEHVGIDCARFNGDFDLPLQLVTREEHQAVLAHYFEVADHDPPVFTEAEQDTEDTIPFGAADQ